MSWQFLTPSAEIEEKVGYDAVITAGMKKRITANHVLIIMRKKK